MAHQTISEDRLAVWLTLAQSGGWWTARTLTRHCTPAFVEWELDALLEALQTDGHVTRREMVEGVRSYAVTSDCLPIGGYALDGTPLTPLQEGRQT
jgi:hypothetical protein